MQNYDQLMTDVKAFADAETGNEISVEQLAQKARYSPNQLTRIFIMTEGITPGEYLRWRRLAKAVYDVKFSSEPILDIALKFGYGSQESFTRVFKEVFGVTPGDYRKSDTVVEPNRRHLSAFLHEESHRAIEKGLWTQQNVQHWIVNHPPRIWASARHNYENLSANQFYSMCGREGVMNRTGELNDVLIEGGAILTMAGHHEERPGENQLCFGVLVADDYPGSLLEGYTIYHIPETIYVVFNVPPYNKEAHGGAIKSIWDTQKAFDIKAHNLDWNYGDAPIMEADSRNFGYTMWFPARLVNGIKAGNEQ